MKEDTSLNNPLGSVIFLVFGKTVLAYHCAAVAAGIIPSIKLIDVTCTSLIQKELRGLGRGIQKLFATARAAAPCILLLDGIENIAPVRGHDNTTEGTMDRVLSTLLTEMDGISNTTDQAGYQNGMEANGNSVVIIGVTHNSSSWIDPALLNIDN